MIKQSLALTERALRYDARTRFGHLLRLLVAISVVAMLFIAVTVPNQIPGRFLMQFLMYGNAVLITFMAPIYFGNCITEEKEEKTLSLLVLANIRPVSLIGGKVLPRLLSLGLVLLVQIPFAMLSITLGGVLLQQLLAGYLALFSYLLAIAGFSTLMSVIFKRSSTAIGMVMVGLISFHVLPSLLWAIGMGLNSVGSTRIGAFVHDAGNWCSALNLGMRLPVVTESTFAERWEMFLSRQFLVSCCFGLFCLMLAMVSFNWFNADPEAEVIRQKRSRLIGTSQRVWSWPLVWKDYYLVGGGHQMAFIKLIGYTLLIGGTFIAVTFSGGGPEGLLVACWWLVWILTLECQFLLASSLSFELNDRTWSSLAILPQNVPTLVYSKVAGAMLSMWPGLAWLSVFLTIGLVALVGGGGNMNFKEFFQVVIFLVLGGLYVLTYLHFVAFYAVWSKNRWLAMIGAFATMTVGYCIMVCPIAILMSLFSMVGPSESAMLVLGAAVLLSLVTGLIALLHYRTLAMLTELQND
ncbi:MAG: hypothetical protein H6824_16630 [Planctomycetaceae bacterium]|nr:hypothetical protein [Planctomycetaceae bacterium]